MDQWAGRFASGLAGRARSRCATQKARGGAKYRSRWIKPDGDRDSDNTSDGTRVATVSKMYGRSHRSGYSL